MLSIAVFLEAYHPMRSGVVIAVESISRTLREMGHAVTIFTSSHPDAPAPEEGVVYFPSMMLPSRARYPLAIPLATGKVRRMLLKQHFDVIHSHSPMLLGHVALYYHRHRGIPLVFTYHTLIEEYTHYIPLPQSWLRRYAISLSREYCNAADHIIAPSEHVRNRLQRYRVERPITTIPTGIDLALLDAESGGGFRQQYGIPADAPLLCYAGRLAREKNIDRLLNAFRLVLAVEPTAHLLLIGGGMLEPALTVSIQSTGLAECVHMTGFVTHEQVIQGLRESTIFVFASKTETQGLVLGEAMACGLPVVAVESDAAHEAMISWQHGLLVPDQDAPFAEAILALLRDGKLRERLGNKARIRAEQTSLHRCTERLVGVYEQVIAAKEAAHGEGLHL